MPCYVNKRVFLMNDGYLNLFLFQIILQIKVRGSIQRNRGGWGGVFAEKNLISMGSYIHCQLNHDQRV